MSGQFIYPPPNSQDVTLNYNYRDSVEVSFETTTNDRIDPYLSLWYYLDGKPWALGYNTSVPSNGTVTVDLNVLDQAYYGQFNFDDGDSVLYLSCFFNVAHNTSQSPTTWGQSAAAAWSSSLAAATATTSSTSTKSTATSTTSASISTSATSSATITSAATQIATPSTTASSSSGLSSGAIAGIAVGVVIGVLALVGMGIFFWWRNRKANKPVQGGFVGELPGGQPSPQQQSFINNNNNNQAEKTHFAPYSDHPSQNSQTTPSELAGHHALQELP
ncbi:cell wall integrity and stress response component [Talaromyces pinophilus]|uniref:Cell wall integrity and stress response component n=1 Tax=Talaromyces pinophilus TaxID=128442 RepID=A0A0B8MYC4_TALPI|nr:cell wall integrity and stress response component [Talaromyces pinophilus]